jgi:hypothetical protein
VNKLAHLAPSRPFVVSHLRLCVIDTLTLRRFTLAFSVEPFVSFVSPVALLCVAASALLL